MKGVIVSMPGTGRTCIKTKDMVYFFKRYGVVCFLGLALVLGLFFGALSAADADEQMLNSLDFLFITNFKARISQSLFFNVCSFPYLVFYFLHRAVSVGNVRVGDGSLAGHHFFKGVWYWSVRRVSVWDLSAAGSWLLSSGDAAGRFFIVHCHAFAGERGILFFQIHFNSAFT